MNMLLQKNVSVDPLCQVCRMGAETVEHILCNCALAVQCWQIILPQVLINNCTSLVQWWEKVLEVCDNEKRAEVVTVCWSIWKVRNELVWNKKYTRINVVIARAKQYLLQWKLAQKQKSQSQYPYFVEGDGKELWVAPQTDYMKASSSQKEL
ncbi:uncharacterized protein LOC141713827 [Apium graveolens]|uniref:uncharacterized protein LOC141713827 n=1 Tax=Apium graveolens TaxID=4045 RepID=UPI003D7BF01A